MARMKGVLAKATERVQIACSTQLAASFDEPTWDMPAIAYAEYDLTAPMHELEVTCEETRKIKQVIFRFSPGGAPAELTADGVLVMRVDPPRSKAEEYFLRRQFGWRWK